jgi:hypothetical protein
MNETFIRKNDIGVDIEYTIIGRYNSDNRDYIIYTDFVSDEKDVLRLFVDMVNGDEYVPISDTRKDLILDEYREGIKKYISSL